MGTDYGNGKVIRPPFEKVSSGKLFRPDSRFRYKMWSLSVFIVVVLWTIVVGTFWLSAYIMGVFDLGGTTQLFLDFWLPPINFWYWVITLPILVIALTTITVYIRSIRYSVRAESGESMPEVYVRKGIIDITEKHVPLRTITNINTKTGPFDRLFGIGSVEIETAGYSGPTQYGPEEKIEGIVFYEELRSYILQHMRQIGTPYVTGTESPMSFEESVPRMEGTLDDEILMALREMRDILRRIDDKLDRRDR